MISIGALACRSARATVLISEPTTAATTSAMPAPAHRGDRSATNERHAEAAEHEHRRIARFRERERVAQQAQVGDALEQRAARDEE